MNTVPPDTGAQEITLAEGQSQYAPLRVALYHDKEYRSPALVSRWTLTDEERLAIAEGADIFLETLTFGHPFQPVRMQVGMGHYEVPDIDDAGQPR